MINSLNAALENVKRGVEMPELASNIVSVGLSEVSLGEEKLEKLISAGATKKINVFDVANTVKIAALKPAEISVTNLKNRELLCASSLPELGKQDAKYAYILKLVLSKNFHFGKLGDELYVYQERFGYYRGFKNFKDCAFHAFILSIAANFDLAPILDEVVEKRLYKDLLSLPGIAVDLGDAKKIKILRRYFNFKNGVYDLETGVLLDHSPRFLFRWYCIANYHADAKICGPVQKYFENLTPNNADRENLFAMIALAPSFIRDLQIAFFLIGAPANGKSTILRFLDSSLPDGLSLPFELEDFTTRFAMGNLDGVACALCFDINTETMGKRTAAAFRRTISLDPQMGEKKYQQKARIHADVLMCFAGNAVPPIDDNRGATMRRILKINTGKSVERQNKEMLDLLSSDRDAIFSQLMPILRKIYNGTLELSAPPDDSDFLQVTDDISLLRIWAEERLVRVDINRYVQEAALLQDFQAFAKKHNVALENVRSGISLGMRIKKLLPGAIIAKISGGAHVVYGYDIKSPNASKNKDLIGNATKDTPVASSIFDKF